MSPRSNDGLPADLQALIDRNRERQAAVSQVADLMAFIGYTADDLSADLDEGGSAGISFRDDEDGGQP